MPLEHSSSPAAFKRNVSTLMGEIGRSPHVANRDQALAIAYATQRRAGHADGGDVTVVRGPQSFGERLGETLNSYGLPGSLDLPELEAYPLGVAAIGRGAFGSNPSDIVRRDFDILGRRTVPARQIGGPINPAMLRPQMPPGMAPPGNVMPMGVAGPANMPFMRPPGRAGGGFNIAKQPNLSPPNYFERGEAQNMMHGPVASAMPGRADTHYTKVPSGSYVLPAAHIASMGQGNSMAGLKLAQSQFGLNGPFGIGAMKMPRGPGAPRPPRAMGFAYGGYTSEGGARGHGHHRPVDVALSGGEYVIHPEVVRNIGHGNLENGHKILDAYVLHARKKEIETQKKLPPPAQK